MYCTLHCVLSCIMCCTFYYVPLHCNFHVSLSFLLIILESKRCSSNYSTLFLSKIYHWSIRNITYTKFQNCDLFSLKFILKEVLPKCTQTISKLFAMEFIFSTKLHFEGLQLYQKYAQIQVFSNIFAQVCCFLANVYQTFTNLRFPENLLVAAFSGRRSRSERT